MVKHIIILGSSYKTGERIALDYPETDKRYTNAFTDIKKIKQALQDETVIATHILRAKSENWEDVVALDPFFDKIRIIKDGKEFIKLLYEDKHLTSIDVAEYILSNVRCSHIKLEKLAYYCYADYLCDYNERLFEDKIYAFKYGPVINNVYKKYRGLSEDEVNGLLPVEGDYNIPIKSRILISKNGKHKLASIDATLEKYMGKSAMELVNLTHKENTPWAFNDRGETPYKLIADKDIKKYHCNENA